MKSRRIFMSLFGVIICAISVGIFKIAALGVDPFQSLMSGLDKLIPISFGTLYVIVNLILLTFSILVDRHNIGIFVIVIICFCSAFYMTADLGVSTYDAVAIVLAYKWKLAKFKFCRIATDLVCVIAGTVIFLIGGGAFREVPTIVGIGTIITAFFMGPLIELFNDKIARPFLNKQ